jgi:hypothetical protein
MNYFQNVKRWHQVKSPELTISVNAFFGDSGETNFITKILGSPQRQALMYWIHNIIQQNMSYPSFRRVLLNLKDSLRAFLFKQWHEVPTSDQLDVMVESIIERFELTEKLRELQEAQGSENKPKNPPRLSIRGLLQRPTAKKDRSNKMNSSTLSLNDLDSD